MYKYYKVFDDKWFLKNKWLISLLNFPVVKYWLRKKFNLWFEGKVLNIGTSGICYELDGKNAFRVWGHWKYSKRVYSTFKWVWWTMHFLDWLVLDRQTLVPNFGFATFGPLTSATGAADPNVDSQIERNPAGDESWATIRAGTGTSKNSASSGLNCGVFYGTTGYDGLLRAVMGYNTTVIGSNTVVSATWTGTPREKADTMGQGVLALCRREYPGTGPTTSDFDISGWDLTPQTTADKSISSMTVDVAFTLTLSAAGIANIDGSGYSYLSIIADFDRDNSTPGTSGACYAGVYSTEEAASKEHHLDGFYSTIKSVNGVLTGSISKINNVELASIGKFVGLTN